YGSQNIRILPELNIGFTAKDLQDALSTWIRLDHVKRDILGHIKATNHLNNK
ncbi:hypothetical protein HHI36_010849, partial [Cryptolaemus montrouzieri]